MLRQVFFRFRLRGSGARGQSKGGYKFDMVVPVGIGGMRTQLLISTEEVLTVCCDASAKQSRQYNGRCQLRP